MSDTVIPPAEVVNFCREHGLSLRAYAKEYKKYLDHAMEAEKLEQERTRRLALGRDPEEPQKKAEKVDFLKINRMFG